VLQLLLVDGLTYPCARQDYALFATASRNHLACLKLQVADDLSVPSTNQHRALRAAGSRVHVDVVVELMNESRVGASPDVWQVPACEATHNTRELGLDSCLRLSLCRGAGTLPWSGTWFARVLFVSAHRTMDCKPLWNTLARTGTLGWLSS
jgi:hypothetical protein